MTAQHSIRRSNLSANLANTNASRLFQAAEEGNLNAVVRIVHANFPACNGLNCRLTDDQVADGRVCFNDKCLTEAARIAAICKHDKILKFLVERISPEVRDKSCKLVAEAASAKCSTKSLEFLLNSISKSRERSEFIILAANGAGKSGSVKLLKLLYEAAATQEDKDRFIRAALASVASSGNTESVKFLVDRIRDQNFKDESCKHAAVIAAKHDKWATVGCLLEGISNSAVKDECCMEVASSPALQQRKETLLFLHRSIANPSVREKFVNNFFTVVLKRGHIKAMQQFLDDLPTSEAKLSLVLKGTELAAARGDHISVIKALIKASSNSKQQRQCVHLAARVAASNRHAGVLKYLINTILQDRAARNACCLETAQSAGDGGSLDVATFLIRTITDQRVKDEFCKAALKSAAANGFVQLVKLLMKCLSCSSEQDQGASIALEAAIAGEHMEVASLLIDRIDDTKSKQSSYLMAAEQAIKSQKFKMVCPCLQRAAENGESQDALYIQAAEEAAKHNGLDFLPAFVAAIKDSNIRDKFCGTATEACIQASQFDCLVAVLQSIVNRELREQSCEKAIYAAASQGCKDTVGKLLLLITDGNMRDLICKNALLTAAQTQQFEVVKHLFRSIADDDIRDRCYLEAAQQAAEKGLADEVKHLVHEAMSKGRKFSSEELLSLADAAVNDCHTELIRFLIRLTAEPSITDLWCCQAADKAVGRGEFHFAVALMELVINKDCRSSWAIANTSLRNQLANLAITGDNEIILHVISLLNPIDLVKMLSLAVSSGHIALALTLISRVHLEHIDLRCTSSATVLMLAADAGHHVIITALLNHGASLDLTDELGMTALSRACASGHLRAVKTLADRGANPQHRNKRGLTCLQLAEQFGHSEIKRLLEWIPTDRLHKTDEQTGELKRMSKLRVQNATAEKDSAKKKLSSRLHNMLNQAGFTQQRAEYLQAMADFLQEIVRSATGDNWEMSGSFAEGWANSLVQVNGRTGVDSDIDWTVLIDGIQYCLCGESRLCGDDKAARLQVVDGHAKVSAGQGSQPAVTDAAFGARPAQDVCHARRCCCLLARDKVAQLTSANGCVHLVCATRPNSHDEMRVSFSFQEKRIMRRLSTVQGQLFTIIKFVFKRLLPIKHAAPGLKTYHAKSLLFFMLEKYGQHNDQFWQPENLVVILAKSLKMMLGFIDSSSSPDECMPHFFMPEAKLYFKNAGIGGDFSNTKARIRDQLCDLRSDVENIVNELEKRVRPLETNSIYFHPFTLLPLQYLPDPIERQFAGQNFSEIFSGVQNCVINLAQEQTDSEKLMKQLALLRQKKCCEYSTLCLTAMAHLKSKEFALAEKAVKELAAKVPQPYWETVDMECGTRNSEDQWNWQGSSTSDWAWRFCFPIEKKLPFEFLPPFTQTLLTCRLSQSRSSHLYANFRCLGWSLQAELLGRQKGAVENWSRQCAEDPDFEELYTLANYTEDRKQLKICVQQMTVIRDEKRVAMETQDEEKFEFVNYKLKQATGHEASLASAFQRAQEQQRALPIVQI